MSSVTVTHDPLRPHRHFGREAAKSLGRGHLRSKSWRGYDNAQENDDGYDPED